MKIKSYKCTCGHDDFFFADKGNQTGIYCSYCGKWLKWADKDEKNLQLKSPNIAEVLDKISAEIEEIKYPEGIKSCLDAEYFVNEGLDRALAIIEKYKGDSK